ncbi:MAG: helix-hairpin-helix domain-containing protein [Candidatus Zixiibacteriota bacterium]|nr:MAG: helix-hairpin-helix domain-containing protein [candidate division Zixibacteria bacterium]
MRFLNFTPQETRAILFLLMALLVGSGIILYQRTHPGFAPQLKLEKSGVDSLRAIQYLSGRGQEENTIDLNRATAAELQLLPGVGPALSRRIVEYREAKGEFDRIEDVMQVSGIGPKTFEAIKQYLTVEDKKRGVDR